MGDGDGCTARESGKLHVIFCRHIISQNTRFTTTTTTMPTRIPPFINDLVAQSRTRQVPVRLSPVKGGGKRAPKFIKGVYNGTYFRYKIPKQKPPRFKIPQLPTSHQIPKSFKSIPVPKHLPPPPLADQLKAWWKENWAVFILNFGSVSSDI